MVLIYIWSHVSLDGIYYLLHFFIFLIAQVPEEERIASLVASNPKLSAKHRKEYEDKMQTFFSNVSVVWYCDELIKLN